MEQSEKQREEIVLGPIDINTLIPACLDDYRTRYNESQKNRGRSKLDTFVAGIYLLEHILHDEFRKGLKTRPSNDGLWVYIQDPAIEESVQQRIQAFQYEPEPTTAENISAIVGCVRNIAKGLLRKK